MADGPRPSEAAIRRALAECMTAGDIDDAMGWPPGTARRRRWRAPERGGLPFADAELGGVALWFRTTIETWQDAQADGRRAVRPDEDGAGGVFDRAPGVDDGPDADAFDFADDTAAGERAAGVDEDVADEGVSGAGGVDERDANGNADEDEADEDVADVGAAAQGPADVDAADEDDDEDDADEDADEDDADVDDADERGVDKGAADEDAADVDAADEDDPDEDDVDEGAADEDAGEGAADEDAADEDDPDEDDVDEGAADEDVGEGAADEDHAGEGAADEDDADEDDAVDEQAAAPAVPAPRPPLVLRSGFELQVGQRVLAQVQGRWREATIGARDRTTVAVDYSVDGTPLGARRQRVGLARIRLPDDPG